MCLLDFPTYQPYFTHSQPQKSDFLIVFSHFLSLFFALLLSELVQELEFRYVHLVGALGVLFVGLNSYAS